MNSATNPQPDAGQGNGSVRTQNQPSWSVSPSSSQSSSLSKTTEVSSNTICPRSIAHKVAARRSGNGADLPGGLTQCHGDGLLRAVAIELEVDLVARPLLRDGVAERLVVRRGRVVDADDDVAAEQVALALDDHL